MTRSKSRSFAGYTITKRRRRPRPNKLTGIWALLCAVCGVVAQVVESVTLLVAAIVMLVIAVVSMFTGNGVPHRGTEVRTTTSSRGSGGSAGKPRKPGTRGSGKPSKPRKCSVRCRRSIQPLSECRCSCNGRSHGSAVSRETLKSPEAKSAERAAKKREKTP